MQGADKFRYHAAYTYCPYLQTVKGNFYLKKIVKRWCF